MTAMPLRRPLLVLGRAVTVAPQDVTMRAMVRTHMRRKGVQTQRHMAQLLDMNYGGFRKWFTDERRQAPPQYIDKIVEVLNLTKAEALALRLQAAIENGWQLEALRPEE